MDPSLVLTWYIVEPMITESSTIAPFPILVLIPSTVPLILHPYSCTSPKRPCIQFYISRVCTTSLETSNRQNLKKQFKILHEQCSAYIEDATISNYTVCNYRVCYLSWRQIPRQCVDWTLSVVEAALYTHTHTHICNHRVCVLANDIEDWGLQNSNSAAFSLSCTLRVCVCYILYV